MGGKHRVLYGAPTHDKKSCHVFVMGGDIGGCHGWEKFFPTHDSPNFPPMTKQASVMSGKFGLSWVGNSCIASSQCTKFVHCIISSHLNLGHYRVLYSAAMKGGRSKAKRSAAAIDELLENDDEESTRTNNDTKPKPAPKRSKALVAGNVAPPVLAVESVTTVPPCGESLSPLSYLSSLSFLSHTISTLTYTHIS